MMGGAGENRKGNQLFVVVSKLGYCKKPKARANIRKFEFMGFKEHGAQRRGEKTLRRILITVVLFCLFLHHNRWADCLRQWRLSEKLFPLHLDPRCGLAASARSSRGSVEKRDGRDYSLQER